MPEDMPDRMPEDMPDRMQEDMPDRMPEDMSDRTPEDLPVTKCIIVMVGITRSKVILVFIYNYTKYVISKISGNYLTILKLDPSTLNVTSISRDEHMLNIFEHLKKQLGNHQHHQHHSCCWLLGNIDRKKHGFFLPKYATSGMRAFSQTR